MPNAHRTLPDRDLNLIRTGPRGGVPVVLVHPVGLDLTYWGAQIEALRREHDVVAFDLPGHGLTPGIPADWTLGRATALLGSVVRRLDAGPLPCRRPLGRRHAGPVAGAPAA